MVWTEEEKKKSLEEGNRDAQEKNDRLRQDSDRILLNNPNFDFEKFIIGVRVLYRDCVEDSARKNSPWGDVTDSTDALVRYCLEIDKSIQDDIDFHARVIAFRKRVDEWKQSGADDSTFDYSQDQPGHNPPSSRCKVCGCAYGCHYGQCMVRKIGELVSEKKQNV